MTDSKKEPIYFQAVPRNKNIQKGHLRPYQSQMTLPIDGNTIDNNDKSQLQEGRQRESSEMAKRNRNKIKRHNHYRKERIQKLDNELDTISLIGSDIDEKHNEEDEYKLSIQISEMDDIDDDNYDDLYIDDAPKVGVTFEQNCDCIIASDSKEEWDINGNKKKNLTKLVNDESDKTSISIAVEVDDDGNVRDHKPENDDRKIAISRRETTNYYERKRERIHNNFSRSKTLPIMINGDNGQKIFLEGIKTIINGQEVILINNRGKNRNIKRYRPKRKRSIPMSPVAPDLDYNNNIVSPMNDMEIESDF